MVEYLNRDGFNTELFEKFKDNPDMSSLYQKLEKDQLSAEDVLAYVFVFEYGLGDGSEDIVHKELMGIGQQECIKFLQETFADTLKTLKKTLKNKEAVDLLLKLTIIAWKGQVNKNEELSLSFIKELSESDKAVLEETGLISINDEETKLTLHLGSEKERTEDSNKNLGALNDQQSKELLDSLQTSPEEKDKQEKERQEQDKIKRAREELDKERNKLIDLTDVLLKQTKELEEKQVLFQAQQEQDKKEKQELKDEKERLENEREFLDKEKQAIIEQTKKLDKQREELEKSKEELEKSKEELEKSKEEDDNSNDQIIQEQVDKKIQAVVEQLQKQIDELKDELEKQQDTFEQEKENLQKERDKLEQEKKDFESQKNLNATTGASNATPSLSNTVQSKSYSELLKDIEDNKITDIEQNLDVILAYMEENNIPYEGDRAGLVTKLQTHQAKIDGLMQAGTMNYEQYHSYIKIAVAMDMAGLQSVDFTQSGRGNTTVFYPIALGQVQKQKGSKNDVFQVQKLYRNKLINNMPDQELESILSLYETQGINTVSIVRAQVINSSIDFAKPVNSSNLERLTDEAISHLAKDVLSFNSEEKRELYDFVDQKIVPKMPNALLKTANKSITLGRYMELILVAKVITDLQKDKRKILREDIQDDPYIRSYVAESKVPINMPDLLNLAIIKKSTNKKGVDSYSLRWKPIGTVISSTSKSLFNVFTSSASGIKRGFKEGVMSTKGVNRFKKKEDAAKLALKHYQRGLKEESDTAELIDALKTLLDDKLLNESSFEKGMRFYTTFERSFLTILSIVESLDFPEKNSLITEYMTKYLDQARRLNQDSSSIQGVYQPEFWVGSGEKIASKLRRPNIYLSAKFQHYCKDLNASLNPAQQKELCQSLTDFINYTPDQDRKHKLLSHKTKYAETYLRLATYWRQSGIDHMADNMMSSDKELLKNYKSDFSAIQGLAQGGNLPEAKKEIADLQTKIITDRKNKASSIEGDLTALDTEHKELSIKLKDVEERITLKAEITTNKQSIDDNEKAINVLSKAIEGIKVSRIDNINKQITIENSTLEELESDLSSLEIGDQTLDRKSSTYLQDHGVILLNIKNKKREIKNMKFKITNLENQKIAPSDEEKEKIKEKEKEKLQELIDELKKKNSAIEQQLSSLGNLSIPTPHRTLEEYRDGLQQEITDLLTKLDPKKAEKENFNKIIIQSILALIHKELNGIERRFELLPGIAPVTIIKKFENGNIKYEFTHQGSSDTIILSDNDFTDISKADNELVKYLKSNAAVKDALIDRVVKDKASQWETILKGGAMLDNNTASLLQDIRESLIYNADVLISESKMVKGKPVFTEKRVSTRTHEEKESVYFQYYVAPFLQENKIYGIDHFEEQKKYIPVDDLVQYYLSLKDKPKNGKSLYILQPEADANGVMSLYLVGSNVSTTKKKRLIGPIKPNMEHPNSPFIHCETTEYTGIKNSCVYNKNTNKLIAPMLLTQKLDDTMDWFGLVETSKPKLGPEKKALYNKDGKMLTPYNYESFELITYGPPTDNRRGLIKATMADGTIHVYDMNGIKYPQRSPEFKRMRFPYLREKIKIEDIRYVDGTGIIMSCKPILALNKELYTEKNDIVFDRNMKPKFFGKGRGLGNFGKKVRTDTDAS